MPWLGPACLYFAGRLNWIGEVERWAWSFRLTSDFRRTLRGRGRTVRTADLEEACCGPDFARRLNLDGDGQGDLAGHGGEQRAIMVYQLGSYRYWAEHLGRSDLLPGIFGENLTVEGLADAEVCIGDRFRIGGAVVEVSQPRDTCYRVGIRLEPSGDAGAAGGASSAWILFPGAFRKARLAPAIALKSSRTGPNA